MSQSLSKIWTHLVFSTKERYPFLSDETVCRDMLLFGEDSKRESMPDVARWRSLGSRAFALRVVEEPFNRQHCMGNQTQFIQVGKDPSQWPKKVSLAGRLRRVFGKSVACRPSAEIHS